MELLVTTPMTVTEIAHLVGFRSLGSFSSLFRRATGETPSPIGPHADGGPYIPTCFIRMYPAGR